jgi:Family of unknown function (DUF6428)
MLDIDKSLPPPVLAADNEPAFGSLLQILDRDPSLALVFSYDGRRIQSGYHITEVKAGHFQALDCGANAESWDEVFIELWDVAGDRTHMPAGKFAAIIRKVTDFVKLDPDAKLTFEVSEPGRPKQLFAATPPRIEGQQLVVDLEPRAASCKPRDRWLAEETKAKAACCRASAAKEKCCA